MPHSFQAHQNYQIPYYQNYNNWQPNQYYGGMGPHIPHPMMQYQVPYQQFPQSNWTNN